MIINNMISGDNYKYIIVITILTRFRENASQTKRAARP